MVLSQLDIKAALEKGDIVFTPGLEEVQWGEASIDLRLGCTFTRFIKKPKGMKLSVADGLSGLAQLKIWHDFDIRGFHPGSDDLRNTLPLAPGEFVLGMTYESVKIPNYLIGRVEGRSTYARVGLSMHQTAPWIQPGWSGHIVLEITNNGPLTIELTPLIDRPCQLSFFELKSPLPDKLTYGARAQDIYQDQTHPLEHGKS